MRRTAKYNAGLTAVKLLGDGKKTAITKLPEHEDLYTRLESSGYWWDPDKGQWQKDESGNARAEGKFSGSMFEDSFGLASGFYRLRIMCHPDEAVTICAEVCKGLTVLEVSQPYPNRKGAGVRVYITAKRN